MELRESIVKKLYREGDKVYLPCDPGAYIDTLFREMHECRNAGLEVIGIFQNVEFSNMSHESIYDAYHEAKKKHDKELEELRKIAIIEERKEAKENMEKLVNDFIVEYGDRDHITVDEVMHFLAQMKFSFPDGKIQIDSSLASALMNLLLKSGYTIAEYGDLYKTGSVLYDIPGYQSYKIPHGVGFYVPRHIPFGIYTLEERARYVISNLLYHLQYSSIEGAYYDFGWYHDEKVAEQEEVKQFVKTLPEKKS